MEADPGMLVAEVYSFIGILVSAAIFLRLAFKARSTGSFRFQLSIFILIWVAAEVPHILDSIGLIDVSGYLEFGLLLHLVSMIIFAVFVGIRSIRFLLPHSPGGSDFFINPTIPLPSSPPSPRRFSSNTEQEGLDQ